MKIQYLSNSGIYINNNHIQVLIDAYKQPLPIFNNNIPLLIIVSHHHHDHYNPIIEKIKHPNKYYYYSYDIKYNDNFKDNNKLEILSPNKQYHYNINNNIINIKTYKSTDEGIALSIKINNYNIMYFADLHLWLWEDDTKEELETMTHLFKKEITKIKKENNQFDISFIVVDPRLNSYTYDGLSYLLKHLDTKIICPIHFSNNYQLTKKLNQSNNKILYIPNDMYQLPI